MNREDKIRILDRLIAIRGKYLKLVFRLRLEGEDAGPIEKAMRRLARRIDEIRGELHDDWSGSATRVEGDLANISRRLQASIRAIEKQKQVPRHIAKAIGYVDRVLEITGRFLGV